MTLRHTLLLLVLSFPASARADVVPMDVTACDMHSVGASCMDAEGSGICAMDTCHALDYENWDRDASASPPSRAYDCVRCVVGGPHDAGPSSAADASDPMTPPPSAHCSVLPGQRTTSGFAIALLIGAAVLARRRAR